MFAVKIYSVPNDIEGTVHAWADLGFDTIMTGRECLSDSVFLKKIHEAGMKLSVVEPVFLAPSEVEISHGATYDKALFRDQLHLPYRTTLPPNYP